MSHWINYFIVTILAFPTSQYLINFAIALTGRTLDLSTTRYVTPTLKLELNPIAKRVGWRWFILLNIVICIIFAFWFNTSLMLFVMGILAAAHNLNQSLIVDITRDSKEPEIFKELVKKANSKILCLSQISYDMAIGIVGAIIICLVGLDISKPIFWIGLALISYSFTVGLLSASNH
ncbi:MAG: hypothetical protein GKB99_00155 [Methanocellales archaeon]|nr:hypothetical protein [Methanocellales archaeon]